MMMNSPSIRRITVAGAGVLGAQIAFQAAVHGFNLFLYDINDSAIQAGHRRLEGLRATYDGDGVASPERTAAALVRTTLTTSLFIDTGKLGVDAGEGFYTYPNPAYLRPGFLS
jgi:3-hydroxyacyl-CoA dehydrogenase